MWGRSLVVFTLLSSCASLRNNPTGGDSPAPLRVEKSDVAESRKFVVSSQSQRASQAALDVMKDGGNIIDAFVATSFVLAVELPYSTGIGGGGFLMFRHAPTKRVIAVDFRETAPAKADKDMFLDSSGNVVREASRTGALAAGVPGFVAGVLEVHNLYGKLSRERVLKPAIDLAQKGFAVSPLFARLLKEHEARLRKYRGSRALFFKDGKILQEGELFVQSDLARTLSKVAKEGRDGFYKGRVAWAIVMYLHKNDGPHVISDFIGYRPKLREPVVGRFDDFEVFGMPPPSSGGILVQQMLNVLGGDFLDKDAGPFDVTNLHKSVSAMQMAFAQRARYFGDGDFVKVPSDTLLSRGQALSIRKRMNPKRALKAREVSKAAPLAKESDHTVHFSMIDAEGNMVASTQTINGVFGNAMVVPGTGVLMNNEMDDFSAKAGAQNLFGAVGGNANAVEGKKRPLSSMSPTLVLEDGEPRFALGSPNGTRIITCVTQTLLNLMAYDYDVDEAVALPRYHHQWMPDELWLEPSFPPRAKAGLSSLGYKTNSRSWGCYVELASKDGSRLKAVADPRGPGAALGL